MSPETTAAILGIPQSRYRGWYQGHDIIIRPRRYGNVGSVTWEAYLPDERDRDYPGEFLGSAPTRTEAFDAAHDAIDAELAVGNETRRIEIETAANARDLPRRPTQGRRTC